MSINTPQFPGQIWNGLSPNTRRTERNDNLAPEYEDWDQITAELLATQQVVNNIVATGDITAVAAGNGLTGGGTSGDVTLAAMADVTTGGDTAPVTVAAAGLGVNVTTLDGDHLRVDFTPANYTPTVAPAEATSLDDLTAHLAGIDVAIIGGGGGESLSQTLAIGTGSGANDIVMAAAQKVSFSGAVLVGSGTTGLDATTTSAGNSATASATGGVALGNSATATNGVAIGASSSAADLSIAIGASSVVAGESVGIGKDSTVGGLRGVAIGYSASSGSGVDNTVVGYNTNVISPSVGCVIIGTGSQARITGAATACTQAIAIGYQAYCRTNTGTLSRSIAIGTSARCEDGNNAVAIGQAAQANANVTVAVGSASRATVINGIAIGNTALVQGANGIAIGPSSDTGTGGGNTVIGFSIVDDGGTNNTLVGNTTRVGGSNNTVMGQAATVQAPSNNCVVIGQDATVTFTSSITVVDYTLGALENIGFTILNGVPDSIVEGADFDAEISNDTTAENIRLALVAKSVAVTRSLNVLTITTSLSALSTSDVTAWTRILKTSAEDCVVIGKGASTVGFTDTVIGTNATCAATGGGNVLMGRNADIASGTVGVGIGWNVSTSSQSVTIGGSAGSTGSTGAVAIGPGANCSAGAAPIAIGQGSTCTGGSGVAIGFSADAAASGIAIGLQTEAGVSSVCIGQQSEATFSQSVAIGVFSRTTRSNQVVIGPATVGGGFFEFVHGEGDQKVTPTGGTPVVFRTTDATPGGGNVDKSGLSIRYNTGRGTGVGTPSSFSIWTPDPNAGTDDVAQTLIERFTVDETGVTIPGFSPPSVSPHVITHPTNGSTITVDLADALTGVMSGTLVTLVGAIPAGSFVVGITAHVDTTVAGAGLTGYDIGVPGDSTRFHVDAPLAADADLSTASAQATGFGIFIPATDILLTPNGGPTFSAGIVRIVINLMTFGAATS